MGAVEGTGGGQVEVEDGGGVEDGGRLRRRPGLQVAR